MTHVAAKATHIKTDMFALAGLAIGVLGIAGLLVGLAVPVALLGDVIGGMLIFPAPIGFLLSFIGLWRVVKRGRNGRFPAVIGLILNLPGTLVLVLLVIFLASRTSGAI